MGDQERALGYADICDRPYLHENFHATALLYRQIRLGALPECFIALSFPFSLFYIVFPRPAPLSRQGKLKNTDIVVASLPSDFHRFLLLRAEWIFAPSFT